MKTMLRCNGRNNGSVLRYLRLPRRKALAAKTRLSELVAFAVADYRSTRHQRRRAGTNLRSGLLARRPANTDAISLLFFAPAAAAAVAAGALAWQRV